MMSAQYIGGFNVSGNYMLANQKEVGEGICECPRVEEGALS